MFPALPEPLALKARLAWPVREATREPLVRRGWLACQGRKASPAWRGLLVPRAQLEASGRKVQQAWLVQRA
jgi:hypothetical protein